MSLFGRRKTPEELLIDELTKMAKGNFHIVDNNLILRPKETNKVFFSADTVQKLVDGMINILEKLDRTELEKNGAEAAARDLINNEVNKDNGTLQDTQMSGISSVNLNWGHHRGNLEPADKNRLSQINNKMIPRLNSIQGHIINVVRGGKHGAVEGAQRKTGNNQD